MCGRYSIAVDPQKLSAFFNAALPAQPFEPRRNAAPSEVLPVLLNEGEREISLLKWGLIPHWADNPSMGARLINARGETVHQKPSFRDAFKKNRCLVLVDGFYEWQKLPSGKKQPMLIKLRSGDPFTLAGLWSAWTNPNDGEIIRSFTIITTTPNELVAPIHDRMPVILSGESEAIWMDNEANPTTWRELLGPYPADLMETEPADSKILRQQGA